MVTEQQQHQHKKDSPRQWSSAGCPCASRRTSAVEATMNWGEKISGSVGGTSIHGLKFVLDGDQSKNRWLQR